MIRLEPSLECGGGISGAEQRLCVPHVLPWATSLSEHGAAPLPGGFFGGKAHIFSVLAAGEAEPGRLLALLPREAAGAAGAEDPAVGLSASLTIKEAELFITLMAGLTLPWSFSFSGLFFFLCVCLEGVQWLLSGFMHSLSSDRGGNRFSSSCEGGWPLPCPPRQSCHS